MNYGIFVEVLSGTQVGHRTAALTGELIAVAAELDHLLGRTRGRIDRGVWKECAGDLAASLRLYADAWRSSASEAELAFQDAVDQCRRALDTMRGELWRLGEESWP